MKDKIFIAKIMKLPVHIVSISGTPTLPELKQHIHLANIGSKHIVLSAHHVFNARHVPSDEKISWAQDKLKAIKTSENAINGFSELLNQDSALFAHWHNVRIFDLADRKDTLISMVYKLQYWDFVQEETRNGREPINLHLQKTEDKIAIFVDGKHINP